jgi:hypothetical protein
MFFSLSIFKSIMGIKRLDGLLCIHINEINIIVDGIQNSLRIVKVTKFFLKIVAPTSSFSTLLHRCIAHKPVRNFRKTFYLIRYDRAKKSNIQDLLYPVLSCPILSCSSLFCYLQWHVTLTLTPPSLPMTRHCLALEPWTLDSRP